MVKQVFVEKKPEFEVEAKQLYTELHDIVGISQLEGLRVIKRYDVEDLSDDLFQEAVVSVFSEPSTDNVAFDFESLVSSGGIHGAGLQDHVEQASGLQAAGSQTADSQATGFQKILAVEYLPGQFDQRADSAAECIQLISQGERPLVKSSTIYVLEGNIDESQITQIKNYLINPVEAREASLEIPDTLAQVYPDPDPVEVLLGFDLLDEDALTSFIANRGLAMDLADIKFCQQYFREEGRPPTITEIKMIDTYWSDHCRHTTFGTILDDIEIADVNVQAAFDKYLEIRKELGRENRNICLMDMGTIGAKYLASKGILTGLDESEEINACTVKVKVDVRGEQQDWLYLFKNETHNHPTEIEPFGGAATCLGGAIRDPLSGRSYVYQAMRVTGAADPTVPVSQTIPGKLPQRKIVTSAAQGYSSYGNQIGLATGQVNEIYHPGYAAKRMEIGAVVGATPASDVRRETPAPGDVVVLVGGRTGRDGIGGATGSSKAHTQGSLVSCGAEVQKGNPPMERKIQRLFRNSEACRMIKRCNDFGAGGVSVAIGELADGLDIDLDAVPRKYEGLDGTEIAISESQERMAVALAPEDVDAFVRLATAENLEATPVATVTEEPRVRMTWRGDTIVDVSRAFLASNGAPKHQRVKVDAQIMDAISCESAIKCDTNAASVSITNRFKQLLSDINVASNKGLAERFDSTIGAATVLMPFGGKRQLTPACAMVAKLPVLGGDTCTVSGLSWGFNPYISKNSQYEGAYLAVLESVAKLVATGFRRRDIYLTFQEYFEKLRTDPHRWGKPVASVLGALMAQVDFEVGAIGGKDSMSGTFEDLDVPPTLVSFATALGNIDCITSPEFKLAGHKVILIEPMLPEKSPDEYGSGLIPDAESSKEAMRLVESLIESGHACAVSTPGYGGLAEALFKMCLGNAIGFNLEPETLDCRYEGLFSYDYGAFIVELDDAAFAELFVEAAPANVHCRILGETRPEYKLEFPEETVDLAELQEAWEKPLEGVFPYRGGEQDANIPKISYTGGSIASYGSTRVARPKVIIPVFPGTNCEYDTLASFKRAGADVDVQIVNNLHPSAIAESAKELAHKISKSQIVMLPGGFSGGDEPDGSAKFIASFFRAPEVTEALRELLQKRDGLMLGICNGFQALVKLGLVPYGDIMPADEIRATLTFNEIGRHQSRLVRTRISSNRSPWMSECAVGDVFTVAISHGEGRFMASGDLLDQMIESGQIATQYVDEEGNPSLDLLDNPNGSALAIEGISSPDGRIFGKMGHSERAGVGLYKNVPGNLYQPIFEAGVRYFQ